MSAPSYASLVAPLREAAVQAAWVQWGSIGLGALTKKPARAIVDPEGLLLASLAFGDHERRLDRVMDAWLTDGARLLSVGRLANLMADYPVAIAEQVHGLAERLAAGGDPRWKTLAKQARKRLVLKVSERGRGALGHAGPDLRHPAALMLRLRLAFGVGIKADALAFLLGGVGASVPVRAIAASTGYHERAVRRALEDLAAARLVEMRSTSPVGYFARWDSWEKLLGVDENSAPIWRGWHDLFVVVHSLNDWGRVADASEWTSYVAASRLRDVFDQAAPSVHRAAVQEHPDWSGPPEAWVQDWGWVDELVERLRGVL